MKQLITLVLFAIATQLSAQVEIGEYQIKNMDVNTEFSDFGTSFYKDGKVIFAAPRQHSIIQSVWKDNGQPFLDIFEGKILEDGQIADKKKVKAKVNSKYHEGGVVFTKDNSEVYFTSNNFFDKKAIKDSTGYNNLQLYKAMVNEKGQWVNVIKLPFNDDQFSTGLPALSVDEKKLYFVSDRPGTLGETDIFVVDILEDGTYSNPKNLGPNVNTPKKEMFPYIAKDNVMYFASEGHDSKGGLDVYAIKKYKKAYSEPYNLSPVNSGKDDFAFIIKDNNKGYFSSDRSGGKGDDDIYNFVASKDIKFICKTDIYGIAKDAETGGLIPEAKVILLDADNNVIETTTADVNAKYSFKDVYCDKDYILKVEKEGFLSDKDMYNIAARIDDNSPIETEVFLKKEFKKVKENLIINLNPIYFAFDKWNILPEAALELDKVVDVMNKYPNITIEAGSHTDSRANNDYNDRLSQKRAQSTLDYIVSKGISKDRITAKGYGETQLVNQCSDGVPCSKADHQLNRRTEFKVIQTTQD